MFKIEDILSEDFSSYDEETQKFMERYTEVLRECIKEELIKDTADSMLKDIDKSKDYFLDVLTEILENGCKGLNKLSTRTLLNTYLDRKGEEDFYKLLEKVSQELE